jgi:hypothetical protein
MDYAVLFFSVITMIITGLLLKKNSKYGGDMETFWLNVFLCSMSMLLVLITLIRITI